MSILKKLDSGKKLSKNEIRELVWEYEIETTYGENCRWTRSVNTIIKIKGRFFSIDWEEGLTEMQENEYWSQPIEVYPRTYEKTITVTEWIPKNT